MRDQHHSQTLQIDMSNLTFACSVLYSVGVCTALFNLCGTCLNLFKYLKIRRISFFYELDSSLNWTISIILVSHSIFLFHFRFYYPYLSPHYLSNQLTILA